MKNDPTVACACQPNESEHLRDFTPPQQGNASILNIFRGETARAWLVRNTTRGLLFVRLFPCDLNCTWVGASCQLCTSLNWADYTWSKSPIVILSISLYFFRVDKRIQPYCQLASSKPLFRVIGWCLSLHESWKETQCSLHVQRKATPYSKMVTREGHFIAISDDGIWRFEPSLPFYLIGVYQGRVSSLPSPYWGFRGVHRFYFVVPGSNRYLGRARLRIWCPYCALNASMPFVVIIRTLFFELRTVPRQIIRMSKGSPCGHSQW